METESNQVTETTTEEEIGESTPLLITTITKTARISGVDFFRGLIMIFESLDHAREFLSSIKIQHEEWYQMPDYHLSSQPYLIWFLRAVTGLCAPGFMALMGLGKIYNSLLIFR